MNFYENDNFGSTPRGNFVYLTKVFYNNHDNGSPILLGLDAAAAAFSSQFNVGNDICGCGCGRSSGCGCGCSQDCCCNMDLSPTATFDVSNAYVLVHSFRPSATSPLTAESITVDGFPITGLESAGGQYMADISGIMADITSCPCTSPCKSSCNGNFVLLTGSGDWELTCTIVLEGMVTDGGNSCQFRLCFDTLTGAFLPIEGDVSVGFCGVDIPCQTDGVSPSLIFDFDACASILNPGVTVMCDDAGCRALISGALVVTPMVNLRVTRPSLFNLNAQEVAVGCDDIGQCHVCNEAQRECFADVDNCCCGQQVQSRAVGQGSNRSSCSSQEVQCQCCDTNGYSYL